jgi:hypothetical protein
MIDFSHTGLAEIAAFVCSHLKRAGIDCVLSGGACVSIYSENKYMSYDLDFIETGFTDRKKLVDAMNEIGFIEENRYFVRTDCKFFVEFPSGPLAVGSEPVKEIVTLKFKTGELRIISPTDAVKDRLAAFYFWDDLQSLEQAILITRFNEIDLDEVKRWSSVENKLILFNKFLYMLKK